MVFFDEFGPQAGKFNVQIIGFNRTLAHMNKIITNSPRMSEDMIKQFADSVVKHARVNIDSRSKYDPINYGQNLFRRSHKPGTLRDSINVLSFTKEGLNTKAIVGIEPSSEAINYASAVEFGRAGGKRIRPRKGRFATAELLAFWWKGPRGNKLYFFKEVIQGPALGLHYMRDGVIKSSKEMEGRIKKQSDNLIKK